MTRFLVDWNPVDVEEIAPMLVTYRPTHQYSPTLLHREMLKPSPKPAELHPDAPNRGAVEHNLRESIRGFERAFVECRKIESGHRLANWKDLLRLNIQHVTAAERHYTNGQATVTSVRAVEGLSVGLHASMERFRDDHVAVPSLVAHALAMVTTEVAARDLATHWLGSVEEKEVPVLVEGRRRSMKWRAWGSAPSAYGYRARGLLLTIEGRSAWTELDEWAGGRFEPYAVLNSLPKTLGEVEADACATCRSFRFSGLSRDMSGGWGGYCMHSDRTSDGGPPPVRVHERCEHHAMILDSDRERPYLRVE